MGTPQPPKFKTDDGLKTDFVKVSSNRRQILHGVIADDVVDMQINLNGSGFTSDPDLIDFENGEFTIPNQNVLPSGLDLNLGKNTIEVRSIHSNGHASAISSAEITIASENEIDVLVEVPSGLRVRRKQDAVEIIWTENDDDSVVGYNLYASSEAGGGSSGYTRINQSRITEPSFEEEDSTVVSSDEVTYQSNQGVLHQVMTEENFEGEDLQTVSNAFLDTTRTVDTVKVSTTVEDIDRENHFSFIHGREQGVGDESINDEFFADIPNDEPLFYVITAVARDSSTGEELESPYSEELIGTPLTINTSITEVPRRTRFDVSEDYIERVHSYDQEISLIPGSVSRDLFVDPFSTEAQRMYFLADFIRKSQSFPTLLQIDDNESYKEALESALGLGPGSEVQNLIDDSFDKLASNVNVSRKESTESVGEVVFYTNSEPTTDLTIPEGTLVSTAQSDGPTITFRVTSRVEIPEENADSYYHINRERWEVTARIRATEAGSQGNLASGQITSVVGGNSSGMSVENIEPTRFGEDEEDNQDLAERAMLALSSVDSGTKQGYLSTALKQSGVLHAEIVDAGHDLMMRDYDSVREENIGGKVDVWIQGQNQMEMSDRFTMNFEIKEGIDFYLDSNPSELIFVTDNSDITPDQPITEVLGSTNIERKRGYSFENITTGQEFNLSNYSVVDYNKIQLDSSINQPSAGPNDIISGDVRFLQSTDFVFTNQPVKTVNSVRSTDNDYSLEEGKHFDLTKDQDPLLNGRSTLSEDYLNIMKSDGLPTSDTFVVNDENHVLTGEQKNELKSIGVKKDTIRVFSSTRQTEYQGPISSDPDFYIEEGGTTTPPAIYRNPNGEIENGEEVSVDYQYEENFTVSYTVNMLLDDVQREIDNQRHITADVVTKEAVSHEINLEMTVVLKNGITSSQVDPQLKTRVGQVTSSKGVGESVHQSDIVKAIEDVDGVSHVIMPMTKMTHSDGNLIVRESLDNVGTFLTSQSDRKIYILREPLDYNTENMGGKSSRHRGVFQDDLSLELVSSYTQLQRESGSAMIVGNQGLVIPGYSDEKTLRDDQYNTQEEIMERRRELTANRIIVSLKDGDSPINHDYDVSYLTSGNEDSRSSIESSSISYIELGDISITYTQE
jgi:uncharacterized phage protein gp47/JayE